MPSCVPTIIAASEDECDYDGGAPGCNEETNDGLNPTYPWGESLASRRDKRVRAPAGNPPEASQRPGEDER